MIETIGAIAGILAVAGVVFNNHKIWWCFPIWLVANSLSCYIHVHEEIYSVAGRDAIFFLLGIHGLWKWKIQPATRKATQ